MAKRRFIWLDGIIIAVIILAITAAGIWYFTKDNGAAIAPKKQYEVTLRVDLATKDATDYYKVGDTMYFRERIALLGTITALTPVDRMIEEYDAVNGRYVKIADPEKRALEMKVLVEADVIDGKFTINGETIHIGQEIYPQSDTTRSVAIVWDIEEVAA